MPPVQPQLAPVLPTGFPCICSRWSDGHVVRLQEHDVSNSTLPGVGRVGGRAGITRLAIQHRGAGSAAGESWWADDPAGAGRAWRGSVWWAGRWTVWRPDAAGTPARQAVRQG